MTRPQHLQRRAAGPSPLGDLGMTLPDVAASVATYVPAVRSDTKVFSAGQLPSSMAR